MELCCLRTDPPGVSLKSSCSRAGQCLGQARLIPSGICRLIYCPQEQLGPCFAQFLLSQPNVEALHDALARSNCCTNQSCFLWSFPHPSPGVCPGGREGVWTQYPSDIRALSTGSNCSSSFHFLCSKHRAAPGRSSLETCPFLFLSQH